ncbi:O-antigen ligase family protein [Pengzhenrongella sicca]|uniref:O-antigen ligase family protein n=1 Tax=Pengzhenrongella sicca TaxID=2819238 RepID=A0A8A4ZED5_9MICO|nr:O-antigen ligase family protein [Pengzhenrongella sicca]QTE28906.1 O-antigen ligase family protein [Pengzhenrongella sicca]
MTAPEALARRRRLPAREHGAGWISAGWEHRVQVGLIVTVWLGVLGPLLVQSVTEGKGFTPIDQEAAPLTGLASAVTTAANGLIVLACAAVVLACLPALAWRTAGVLVLLVAPWGIAAVQLVVLGRPPGAPALIYPAVAAAFWALRPRRAAIETVGYLTGATALVSLLLGALLPDAGRYPLETAGLEKVIGPAGVLSGVMPTGNNLGLLLVVGLPTVFAIRRVALRWVALGAVALALAWTISRTSWVAALVVLVMLAALAWLPRRGQLAGLGLGLLALVGLVVPFVTSDPDRFTHRAGYWIATLDAWRDSPLVGYGADYFKQIANTPADLGGYAYHAHNQGVQLLITGGLLLTVAVLALLALAAVRAVRLAAAGVPWAAGWLAALLAVGVLEVPLGFVDRMMFLPVTLVPLCLLLCADRTDDDPAGPVPGVTASSARPPAGAAHG